MIDREGVIVFIGKEVVVRNEDGKNLVGTVVNVYDNSFSLHNPEFGITLISFGDVKTIMLRGSDRNA